MRPYRKKIFWIVEEAVLWVFRKTIFSCWLQSVRVDSRIKCFGWILPFWVTSGSFLGRFGSFQEFWTENWHKKPVLNEHFSHMRDSYFLDFQLLYFPLVWPSGYRWFLRNADYFWLVLSYNILKRTYHWSKSVEFLVRFEKIRIFEVSKY